MIEPCPAGLDHYEAVDGLVGEPVDGLAHIVGFGALHLYQVDGVVSLGCGLQYPRGGQGFPGALDLLGEHADRLEGPPSQGLCRAVGGVTQLVHRSQHLLAGGWTHIVCSHRDT